MDFLDKLNPQQKRAVSAGNGPVLVVAGPGSGKTRVLTQRIAYLIARRGVQPWQILAVTFTNKAADEMRKRVEQLLGARGLNVALGTFHSTCVRILRKWHAELGFRHSFVIYDDADQLQLVRRALADHGGRIVDTAGDGAFLCFPDVNRAATAMIDLLRLISAENASRSREHQLAVRIGIHYGPVLTDGVQVTGDAANFCARITSTVGPGEIRLSKAAFLAFTDIQYRLKCRMLPPAFVKGIDRPADMVTLEWRDHKAFPVSVRLETGEEFVLPDQDIIAFGRLKEKDGLPANDIVLECRDEQQTLQISRWHFEIRRRPDGSQLRAVTSAPIAVNGRALTKGEEIPIRPGDSVRVGNVLGLQFQAAKDQEVSSETVMPAGL